MFILENFNRGWPSASGQVVGRATFLAPAEHSPKSEGMIYPVALWRRDKAECPLHLTSGAASGRAFSVSALAFSASVAAGSKNTR